MATGHEKNEARRGCSSVSCDYLRFVCELWPVMQRVTANGEKYPLTVAVTLFIIQRKAYFPHLFTLCISQFYLYFTPSLSLSIFQVLLVLLRTRLIFMIETVRNKKTKICHEHNSTNVKSEIPVNWKKYSNIIHSV